MGKTSSQKQRENYQNMGEKIREKIEMNTGRRRNTICHTRKKPQNWFRDNKR